MAADTISTSQRRLDNIQALRGVAAFSVMLAHLFQIEKKYSAAPVLPEAFNFGMAGVDLFFLISGFIMIYISQKLGAGLTSARQFIFARITRIYPLYWTVSFVLLILYFIRPDMVFGSSQDPNLVKSFFLWPDTAPPLLNLGWTLIHEMGFYLVFALLLCLPSRLRPLGLLSWGSLVGLGIWQGWNLVGPMADLFFHPLTYEFLIGAAVGYLYLYSPKIPAWTFLLLGVFLTLLSMSLWDATAFQLFENDWARILYLSIPLGLVLIGALYLERHGRNAPHWLIKLGDWSYSLYLTHVLSLSLIGRIWAGFTPTSLGVNLTVLILMLLFAVLVSGLTYKLIEQPLLKAFRNKRQPN